MNSIMLLKITHNAVLLLGLSVVYEIGHYIPQKWKFANTVINGFLIGLIGMALMSVPFIWTEGIFFDTRTILIGVTALIFGGVSTLIASGIMIVSRISIGGAGTLMGVCTIVASAVIGLLWRRHLHDNEPKRRWLDIYLFGILCHVAMLACVFFIPWPLSLDVFKEIVLPVILVYPIVTLLLSMLLMQQKKYYKSVIQIVEAEGRYKSLFNNNHAVMLILRPDDGQIIDANPAACSFYGWDIKTLKTMKITQINTLTYEQILEEMQKAVTNQKDHFLFQHRKASGEIVDVETHSGHIKMDGETFLYSIVHDISARVASERLLLESENRFRMLIESAPDAVFIQIQGKFAFVNRSAVSLFGAESADQLIGTNILDRINPGYRNIIKERIAFVNREKEAIRPVEEVFLRMDGTSINADVSAVPLHFNEEDGALVFARDITERKRLDNMKKEIEAQLREQQKLEAIGTLAGGVAHEINNPINGIMNYAQLILDEIDKDSQAAEYTKEIVHETERVSTIVKNLLQFSRQEKQSHSYASVYDIVDQTVSLIKTIIRKDQIRLDIILEEGLPKIKCRSQQIQQVLMNLLTNARDTLNEKYPDYHENKMIRLSAVLFMSEGRSWIRIIIEDHGNGIPENLREKIFEPFFSTKPKDLGTGLGLSISFGIIKDHHGKIVIDTQEGCYTKFILELPVDNGWTV